MYKATVTVQLRPSILDPEGKAIEHALASLGFDTIRRLRVGRTMQMDVDAPDDETARAVVEQACRQLLANPVMEDFTISIVEG